MAMGEFCRYPASIPIWPDAPVAPQHSNPIRPLLIAMEDREPFQLFTPNAIWNEIRSAGNNQLASPEDTARPPNVRFAFQREWREGAIQSSSRSFRFAWLSPSVEPALDPFMTNAFAGIQLVNP